MRSLQQQLSGYLDQRILLAESRIAFALATMAVLFVLWMLVGSTIAPRLTGLEQLPPQVRAGMMALLLSTLIWNVYLGLRLQGAREQDRKPPPWLRWVAITVESLVPTTALVLSVDFLQGEHIMSAPFLPIYGVALALSTLRLRPALCLYGGVLSGASCAAIALTATHQLGGLQGAPGPHVLRGFSLVLVGVACAIVAHVLRRGFTEAGAAMEDRNRVVGVFGRYLSDDVVDTLLHRPGGLELGGKKQAVTVLMTDLRGFSTLASELPADDVVRLLNHYLGAMTEVILHHGGTIDEFIGDAILVIFNAPLPQDDHARRALRCAVAMQQTMQGVNQWTAGEGLPLLEMGIGVHSGPAVVGNIGSTKRQKYGVVGTTVNLTARVESLTVGGQVLATAATITAAGETVRAHSWKTMHPKGAREPVAVFRVEAVDELSLSDGTPDLLPVAPQPVQWSPVQGKERLPGQHAATLRAVSSHELRLTLPPVHDDAMVVGGDVLLHLSGGVAFARVMEHDGDDRVLRFTARDQRAQRALDALLTGLPGAS